MIDHARYLIRIIEKMFPVEIERHLVLEILDRYGHEGFHPEVDRVKMGVLKLAGKSPERIRYFTLMACRDYRDVLSAAEYPNQVGKYYLKEKEPSRYHELVEKDERQYQDWYLSILWEGEAGEQ